MDSTTVTKKPTYPGYGIDFIKNWTDPAAPHTVGWTNFDVHPEIYEYGVESGRRMVFQIMAALEKMPDNGDPEGLARSMIEEAAKLCESEDKSKARSFSGVAAGVLMTFDDLIVEIARTGLWRSAMVKILNSELDYLKREYDDHAESTMAFMAKLGATPEAAASGSADGVLSDPAAADKPSAISPAAIAALEGMANQAASLADLCNGAGMVVDVLDQAATTYKEATKATESDVLLSILCTAESFAAAAWAIARCEAIDSGNEHSPHLDLLAAFKDRADKLANEFDCGGIHHPDAKPSTMATKKAKANVRKVVAA